MGKRYQTSQPNLAFTVVGSKGIEIIKFAAGEYPAQGTPDIEDANLIRALENHRHFEVLFYEKGQVPDKFGITQQRRAELVASARAILEAKKAEEVDAERERAEEAFRPTYPSTAEIAQMRKEEIVDLLTALGIKHDPDDRVLVLKTKLRKWIGANPS